MDAWYSKAGHEPHNQGQVYDEKGKTLAVTYDDKDGKRAALFAASFAQRYALARLIRVISADHPNKYADLLREARAALYAGGSEWPDTDSTECPECGKRNIADLDERLMECHDCGVTFSKF